jgi:AraC-like DNA-binding protein
MSTVLSIDSLPAARRTPAWRDAVCSTFVRLECSPARHAPLHGRIDAQVWGDLHVSRVLSSPQVVERTAARATGSDEAYVLLSVQLRGRTIVQQGAAQADLTPGSIAFYDTTRPYTLTLPADFEQIVLHLPHAAIERAVPGGLDHMAQRIGPGNPYAQALVAVAPQLLQLSACARPGLAERTAAAARELMALALESLAQPAADTRPNTTSVVATGAVASALVWRARDTISRRLADPQLAPAGVAAEVGVSLRRLQEAFQQQGCTVADCIWDMRLELARSMLAATADVAIGAVAQRAGFLDSAHFSRRFRVRFGLSPRAYRSTARQG